MCANKTATVVVVDVFALEECARSAHSPFNAPLRCSAEWCLQYITQKQLFAPYDEVALILCRSSSSLLCTTSASTSAAAAAEGVEVVGGGLHVPSADTLAAVTLLHSRIDQLTSHAAKKPQQQAQESGSDASSGESSVLCGIHRAVKLLTETRKSYVAKQIVALLPDGGCAEYQRKDLILSLLDLLSEHHISLLLLGLHNEEEDDEGGAVDLTPLQRTRAQEVRQVFTTLCTELNQRCAAAGPVRDAKQSKSAASKYQAPTPTSAVLSWSDALQSVRALRTRKGMVRPLCKIPWSIGGCCKIATQLFTRSAPQTVPSLKKVVPRHNDTADASRKRSREAEEVQRSAKKPAVCPGQAEGVEWEDVVQRSCYFPLGSSAASPLTAGEEASEGPATSGGGPQCRLSPEELLTAFRYGSTWIPCSDADVFMMKVKEPVRSVQTLGFVPHQDVWPFISSGGGGAKALLPLADDVKGRRGFAALALAMQKEGLVAVVRYVRLQNTAPKLGLLSVPLESETQDFDEELGVVGASGPTPTETMPPRFLVFSTLPFQDDVRLFQFPRYDGLLPRSVLELLEKTNNPEASESASEDNATSWLGGAAAEAVSGGSSTAPSAPTSALHVSAWVEAMTISSRVLRRVAEGVEAPRSSLEAHLATSPWAHFPHGIFNPTWQHFFHVLGHKLQVGAMELALNALGAMQKAKEKNSSGPSETTATSWAPSLLRCCALQGNVTSSGGDTSAVAALQSDMLYRLQRKRGETLRTASRLSAALGTTSTGFHSLLSSDHVLLPLFQHAAPYLAAVCADFPALALTAEEEMALAAETVAAARRRRQEYVEGRGERPSPALRGPWFSMGDPQQQAGASSPTEKTGEAVAAVALPSAALDTHPSDGAAAPSAQCTAPPAPTQSLPALTVERVSTIDPAGSLEQLLKRFLAEHTENQTEALPSVEAEAALYRLLMELEDVVRELLRYSFPDTHYLKVQAALRVLRHYCALPCLNRVSPHTGAAEGGASLFNCHAYYNDYLKKLLLWSRSEGHEQFFVRAEMLTEEAARVAAVPQQQQDQQRLVQACLSLPANQSVVRGTSFSAGEGGSTSLLPIIEKECALSALPDAAAALHYLLDSIPVATPTLAEDDVDDIVKEEDVDDWIE